MYICVRVCVCVCFSSDRPLEFTSPYPALHGHMVVTSHTLAKPRSHDLSRQRTHQSHTPAHTHTPQRQRSTKHKLNKYGCTSFYRLSFVWIVLFFWSWAEEFVLFLMMIGSDQEGGSIAQCGWRHCTILLTAHCICLFHFFGSISTEHVQKLTRLPFVCSRFKTLNREILLRRRFPQFTSN